MNYCINPHCEHCENAEELTSCLACGTPLVLDDRYRLVRPLRSLESQSIVDVFEVSDGETLKVMKVLKTKNYKLVELFRREAQLLQSLNIPGIPQASSNGCFNVSLSSGNTLYCLVMEKVEGENLDQWLLRGETPIPFG